MSFNACDMTNLLYEYGINIIVFSSDSADTALYTAVKKDRRFKSFNCVDERSAAYFAMGISIEKKQPVAVACKEHMNAYNFFPAATESYYRNIPLLMLVEESENDNNEIICNSFRNVTSSSVRLPCCDNIIDNNVVFQQALHALTLRDNYPVFISYKSGGPVCQKIGLKKIKIIDSFNEEEIAVSLIEKLQDMKVIVLGTDYRDNQLLSEFIDTFNCIHISGEQSKISYDISEVDLIISFEEINNCTCIPKRHWHISAEPYFWDRWGKLEYVWTLTPHDFMRFCIDNKHTKEENLVSNKCEKVTISDLSTDAIKGLSEQLYSILELLSPDIVQTSCRWLESFINNVRWNNCAKIYANSSLLSNGAISTFLGEAFNTNKEALLITDDVAFFKDINSLMTRNVSGNIHILILDKAEAASIYYSNYDEQNCKQHLAYEATIKSAGFRYYEAENIDKIPEVIEDFCKKSYIASVLRVCI